LEFLIKKVQLDTQTFARIEKKIEESYKAQAEPENPKNDFDFSDKKILGVHELEKELSNIQLLFSKKDERLRLLVWLHRVKDVFTRKIVASTGMLTSLQEEGVCFYLNNSESTDDADKRLLAGVLIDKMEFLETTLQKTDQYLSMLFEAPEESIAKLETEFP
jgi:hypothetical protein